MCNILTPKVGKIKACTILFTSTIVIILGLIIGINIALDVYNDEMHKQYIIKSNIEEQQRIEAEREAKRQEEEALQ